jgi:periplasmic nitrate reductase NapD
MADRDLPNRRDVLLGRVGDPWDGHWHISSAVVRIVPARLEEFLVDLGAVHGVEVAAVEHGKVVLVMEGASSGELGEKLTVINLMEGVISASMVFEHSAAEEELHDERPDQT